MMQQQLDPPVDPGRDHILGPLEAEMTLVEYGSYACPRCHAVHEVIEGLRSRFGERMRYVFRQLPVAGSDAARASELAEYAAQTTGRFWEAHEALMEAGSAFSEGDFGRIARDLDLPPGGAAHGPALAAAQARVREDTESARRSGVRVTPTFFINGRRYAGTWDESSLADAMLGSLGHRIQSAAFEFVRWGPSSGLLLGLATLLALVLSNSPLGAAFAAWWETPLGFQWGTDAFAHSLLHWANHGLLTVFFFVVGLEIKREFTVGHLATLRSGALPVIAALGGIALPAIIYASIAPPALRHGWGIPIGTDTAFAVALIVLLGRRVPIELRVFLTAAVIIDDIVAIVVIALFYTGEMHAGYLIAGVAVTALLLMLNRAGVYGALPYGVLGIVLWVFLHEAGLHATLAGVILAMLIPTRPPANLDALLAQAATVIHLEDSHKGDAVRALRAGPARPGCDPLPDRVARRQAPPIRRALVELRGATDLRAGERGRRLVARRTRRTRTIDRRDHAGAGPRQADRNRAGRVAGGVHRRRGEAGGVFLASVVRRRRARRHRLHDVPVHRGGGLPGPGGLRGRQDRDLPRLVDRRRIGCAGPVAEARGARRREGELTRSRDRHPPGPQVSHSPGRTTSTATWRLRAASASAAAGSGTSSYESAATTP